MGPSGRQLPPIHCDSSQSYPQIYSFVLSQCPEGISNSVLRCQRFCCVTAILNNVTIFGTTNVAHLLLSLDESVPYVLPQKPMHCTWWFIAWSWCTVFSNDLYETVTSPKTLKPHDSSNKLCAPLVTVAFNKLSIQPFPQLKSSEVSDARNTATESHGRDVKSQKYSVNRTYVQPFQQWIRVTNG